MNSSHIYSQFEKPVISKFERFKILKNDLIELKSSFNNKIILICGAAGSIGSQFSKDFFDKEFNPKMLIFLDKDENLLTELNRELLLFKNFKKIKKKFICSDLTSINIDEVLSKNKVQIYLNFAAIKHVRSEENIESIKYMFETNSIKFLPKKINNLKKIFSISTDKTVKPSSILGISKKLMEMNLSRFNQRKIFISSVRFANVAFSNGSILKYIVDRLMQKKSFGLPENVKRFFLTHKESSNLCFKSLLARNNRKIIIPNPIVLKKDFLLSDLAEKIIRKFNYIPKFYKKGKFKNNYKKNCYVLLTPISDGQKHYEELFSENEKIFKDPDSSVYKVDLPIYNKKVSAILRKVMKIKNIKILKKYLSAQFNNYNPPRKHANISKTI